MDRQKAPRKQDGQLSVKYDSFTGVMHFFWDGEERYKKTIPECVEQFPHILWWEIKKNQNTKYVL